MARREALTDLLEKVEAGEKYSTAGDTLLCMKAFPKPEGFSGTSEEYSKSAAQQAILAWRNGSLDAAKALHEAVLPGGWEWWRCGDTGDMFVGDGSHLDEFWSAKTSPARAWLIAIIKALIEQEEQAKTALPRGR